MSELEYNLGKHDTIHADKDSVPDTDLAYLDSLKNIPSERFAAYLAAHTAPRQLIDLRELKFDGVEMHKPRGSKVRLPVDKLDGRRGGLREVIPRYLLELIAATGGEKGPIGLQFIARPELEALHAGEGTSDALEEDHYIVAPGVTYKYRAHTDEKGHFWPGRVLVTFTYDCAAYCRFCTRGRHVGGELHTMSKEDIDKGLDWIENNDEVDEVILSGGDPLAMKPEMFAYVMKRLGEMQRAGKLNNIRIGTRFPIHNPRGIEQRHYDAMREVDNLHLMLHINHPHELTVESVQVINKMRASWTDDNGEFHPGAVPHSQTVLLKGVNDNVQVMHDLFRRIVALGIDPYYIFIVDPQDWTDHFALREDELRAFADEYSMMLVHGSGLVNKGDIVFDAPGENGKGKSPLPKGHMLKETDLRNIPDYNNNTVKYFLTR